MATIATVQVLVDGDDDTSTVNILRSLKASATHVPGVLALRVLDAHGHPWSQPASATPDPTKPESIWDEQPNFVIPLESSVALDPRETGKLSVYVPPTDDEGRAITVTIDVDAFGVRATVTPTHNPLGLNSMPLPARLSFKDAAHEYSAGQPSGSWQHPDRLVHARTGQSVVGMALLVPAVATFDGFSIRKDGWIECHGTKVIETLEAGAFPRRSSMGEQLVQYFYDAQMQLVPHGVLKAGEGCG